MERFGGGFGNVLGWLGEPSEGPLTWALLVQVENAQILHPNLTGEF